MSEFEMLGESPTLARLREAIQSAARSDASVLIEGETGVGKDLAARSVHSQSHRKARRFVAINCAALPDSLLESELFGHVRGSFTGAYRDKTGLAAVADGGTMFLDEVGEMSRRMQAVLLRFVENGEIQPVGSDRHVRTVDVRLISATNRSLSEQIAAGSFRPDLYYRLNVIRMMIPPLRERGTDILLLLKRFLSDFAQLHGTPVPLFTASALDALSCYGWPGNIRELKNLAEQIVLKGLGRPIERSDLPAEVAPYRSTDTEAMTASSRMAAPAPAADRAWDQVVQEGQTFWQAVYEVFMDRELTKTDVRRIVSRGLQQTHGSYRQLAALFRLSPREYRRFLAFLHQYDCHILPGPAVSVSDGNESVANASKTA
jgi:transcriptional regulator with GAF, ATPase, and Fis domain